jgi:hypothetical protein
MKINFDNFRTQLAESMNNITKLQNEGLVFNPEYEDYLFDELERLRCGIGALMCIFDPSQEHFSDLSDFEMVEIKEAK